MSKLKHAAAVYLTLAVLLAISAKRSVRAALFDDGLGGEASDPASGIDLLGDTLNQGNVVANDQNLTEFVFKYVNFFLPYLALLAFVGLVYAGFLYVTNFGNEEFLTKAKRILVWSILGLLLVILSYSIVNLFSEDLVKKINQ